MWCWKHLTYHPSLTLNRFQTLSWCFHCWPEKSKCWLSSNFAGYWKSIEIKGTSQLIFTCSKSTTETVEKGVKYVQKYFNTSKGIKYVRRRSDLFIVNFEHVSHLFLLFLLLNLNKQMLAGLTSISSILQKQASNQTRKGIISSIFCFFVISGCKLRANLIAFVFLDHQSLVNTG